MQSSASPALDEARRARTRAAGSLAPESKKKKKTPKTRSKSSRNCHASVRDLQFAIGSGIYASTSNLESIVTDRLLAIPQALAPSRRATPGCVLPRA